MRPREQGPRIRRARRPGLPAGCLCV